MVMETVCRKAPMVAKTDFKTEALQTFRRFLEARGLRMTRDRRAIVEQIFSTSEHFSMDDLFIALRLKGERLSKTTLYRNLPLLIESGLIRRVPDESASGRFEHVWGQPHHDHLICLGCGREIEFSCDEIEKAQEEICRMFDFEPVRHRLGIWGYCRNCRKQVGGEKNAEGGERGSTTADGRSHGFQ